MEKVFSNYLFITILFLSCSVKASDLNIIGIGLYDFNKQKDDAMDFRFEKRYDKTFFDLGPKEEPLYSFKPFYGIEITSDSAFYVLGGLFIEEKISKNIYISLKFPKKNQLISYKMLPELRFKHQTSLGYRWGSV